MTESLTYEKKILPKYFKDVAYGNKTFELREDEGEQVGDILLLKEWDGERYTERYIRCEVTYVLRRCEEYGLKKGYCIMGIKAVGWRVP